MENVMKKNGFCNLERVCMAYFPFYLSKKLVLT